MKLRSKLFLPLFVFSLLFSSYAYFVLTPGLSRAIEDNARQDLNAHLGSVVDGLIQPLLTGQIHNVHTNLDAVLAQNPSWLSLTLRDCRGALLYPTAERVKTIPTGEAIKTLTYSVGYLEDPLGTLELTVDLGSHLRGAYQLTRQIKIAFLILLAAITLVSMGLLEWLVKTPIGRLANAANLLSNGVFSAPLPRAINDEVGDLVRSFRKMRDAIGRYQEKLKSEIIDHKQTSESLRHEKERASHQASHDELTGLPNRREFIYRVKTTLQRRDRPAEQHALLYLDLDQFKVVNDTSGHIAGDAMLVQISSLLHHHTRQSDTLARLGGDEFALLLQGCNETDAAEIANQLCKTVQDFRFAWDNKTFAVGVSIGLVMLHADTSDFNSALSAADAACYAAKNKGRNRVQIYRLEDESLARQQGEMSWVSRIVEALSQDRFTLFCQPIVPLHPTASQHQNHYEILIRMVDHQQKVLPPDLFIPAAERYGFIAALDQWVVDRTLAKLQRSGGVDRYGRPLHLAINLAGPSLESEPLVASIEKWLQNNRHSPATLCFEITETAAIQNLTTAVEFIRRLQKLGCLFSLDDFGSGLSSFNYLKILPIDNLKIDGALVREIADDPVALAIVKSIAEIGHVLGKKTIAEFVENEAILAHLRTLQVDFGQGYHLARPFPLRQLLPQPCSPAITSQISTRPPALAG